MVAKNSGYKPSWVVSPFFRKIPRVGRGQLVCCEGGQGLVTEPRPGDLTACQRPGRDRTALPPSNCQSAHGVPPSATAVTGRSPDALSPRGPVRLCDRQSRGGPCSRPARAGAPSPTVVGCRHGGASAPLRHNWPTTAATGRTCSDTTRSARDLLLLVRADSVRLGEWPGAGSNRRPSDFQPLPAGPPKSQTILRLRRCALLGLRLYRLSRVCCCQNCCHSQGTPFGNRCPRSSPDRRP
jgi:hypothetical protein